MTRNSAMIPEPGWLAHLGAEPSPAGPPEARVLSEAPAARPMDAARNPASRRPSTPGAPHSIVLVGLMGAGKSSIGRRLALRVGLPFRDADGEIEAAARCSIAELFARYGEASFREGERRVIRRLLAGPPLVLATGGGAFMDASTRDAIRAGATSVWLRCSLEVLARRVSGRTHRPLLANADPVGTLSALMAQRHPTYAEADIIVDSGEDSPDVTTRNVMAALNSWRPPERVAVRLQATSYDVIVGDGLLSRAGSLLAPVLPQKRCVVVTDETVAGLHLPALLAGLTDVGIEAHAVLVPPGEASKSLATYGRVAGNILEHGVERRTAVIALGGGVIGDLAGFVAASVLRGLPFVQVPTTLLAQVDSSVGGKTGINTTQGKNLLGAFHQPIMVLADTAVLATLPAGELRAGYAEIVKAGLIADRALYAWCEGHAAALLAGDAQTQAEAVLRACAFKARVVADDEHEEAASDGRALLNLGHTFAHAFERETGYGKGLLHGEAVGLGLCLAFALSARLGVCPHAEATRVATHIATTGLPSRVDALPRRHSAAALVAHMHRDKKMRDGRLAFVLVRGIGQAFTSRDVPFHAVVETLRESGCDA